MTLLTKCFPPLPYYLVPLRPKYSPPHPILQHRLPIFLPQYERQLIQITTRKEIIGLIEDAVFTDYRMIGVAYRPTDSTAAALNVSPNNFRIFASYVTAPPILITHHTKTCSCLHRSTADFDNAREEIIRVQRQNSKTKLMFKMQNSIIFMLLLSSGAVSAGLEKVLGLAEFIADIYQQFPHSCFSIINPEAQQQGTNEFYIIYRNFVFAVNRFVLTEYWRLISYELYYVTRNLDFRLCNCC